ncbi:MAG: hypothetical protein M1371_08930 [Actinobacteria bacterium]|nr:hypothetical protein [Actinomycetota bacterium]
MIAKSRLNYFEILIFAIVAIFLLISAYRYDIQSAGVYGDLSTYLMEAQSIAYDFDIRYEQKDVERFYMDGWQQGPRGLFLLKSHGDFFYAKPYIFPFVLSPFVRIFESRGVTIFNAVCFILIGLLGYLYSKRVGKDWHRILFLFLFLSFSTAYIFIYSTYADLFIALVLFLAVFFWVYPFDRRYKKGDLPKNLTSRFMIWGGNYIISSIFFAISIYQRVPTAIFAGLFFLWMLLRRKFMLFAFSILAFLLTLAVCILPFYLVTDNLTPYTGNRLYVRTPDALTEENLASETPEGVQTDASVEGIAKTALTRPLGWGSGYVNRLNIFYYFFGRQTGIIYYFPFVLISLIIWLYSKRWRLSDIFILVSIILYSAMQMLQGPANYYGGSTSFGNRYFLQVYPVMLFLTLDLDKKKFVIPFLIAGVLIGSVFLGPYLLNPNGVILGHSRIMMEAPFSWLPVEKTQVNNIFWDYPPSRNTVATGEYTVYRINTGSFDFEDEGCWIKGRSTARFLIKTPLLLNELSVSIKNGLVKNKVTVSFDGASYRMEMEPGQESTVRFKIDNRGKKLILTDYFYELRVVSDNGFIPKVIDRIVEDGRSLGVYMFYPIVKGEGAG